MTSRRAAAAVRAVLVSLFLGTAALAGVVVAATPSFACSCALPSAGPEGRDAGPASDASAVVVGTIVDRFVPPAGAITSSTDPAVWTVRVETVLKGSAVALERVVTAQEEASCGGLGIGVDVNQRAVLFLRAQDPPVLGARYTSSFCSGGRAVASAAEVAFPGAVASSPSPGGSVPERSTAGASGSSDPSSAPSTGSGSSGSLSGVSVLGVPVAGGGRAWPVVVLGAAVVALLGVVLAVAARTRRPH